jgi:hypothetical protein
MSTLPTNCPSCVAELPDRGFYCPSCTAQARCKSCRELLEPGARACVECGTPVGDGVPAGADGRPREAIAPNRIRLEETRTSRSLDVSVTDAAVEHLSEPLSAFLAGGLRDAQASRRRQDRRVADQIAEQMALPVGDDDAIEVAGEVIVPPARPGPGPATPSGDRERLRRLFKYDGDRLVLQDKRLKANTKIEFFGRLTCLFLYAHELEGRDEVPYESLREALSAVGVWGADTRRWLEVTPDLMPTDGKTVSLSIQGKERAVAALNSIHNPDEPAGTFVPGASAKTRSAKSDAAAGTGDDEGQTTRRKSSGLESARIAPWVDKWKTTGAGVRANDVLRNKKNADKGLFGLWAIRTAVGDEGKLVSRLQLSQFLYQAFVQKVDGRSLETALKATAMKDLVVNVTGTKFQITQDGMEYVQRMVDSASADLAAAPAGANGSNKAAS